MSELLTQAKMALLSTIFGQTIEPTRRESILVGRAYRRSVRSQSSISTPRRYHDTKYFISDTYATHRLETSAWHTGR